MLKRIIRAALKALVDELQNKPRVVPKPPPRFDFSRDACDVCGTEPTTDVREIRLDRRGFSRVALRVCATHARVAPTKVADDLEEAIDAGHFQVPNDEVYG